MTWIAPGRVVGHQLVHELDELEVTAAPGVPRPDLVRGDVQGGEQDGRAARALAVPASLGLQVGQAERPQECESRACAQARCPAASALARWHHLSAGRGRPPREDLSSRGSPISERGSCRDDARANSLRLLRTRSKPSSKVSA